MSSKPFTVLSDLLSHFDEEDILENISTFGITYPPINNNRYAPMHYRIQRKQSKFHNTYLDICDDAHGCYTASINYDVDGVNYENYRFDEMKDGNSD